MWAFNCKEFFEKLVDLIEYYDKNDMYIEQDLTYGACVLLSRAMSLLDESATLMVKTGGPKYQSKRIIPYA